MKMAREGILSMKVSSDHLGKHLLRFLKKYPMAHDHEMAVGSRGLDLVCAARKDWNGLLEALENEA